MLINLASIPLHSFSVMGLDDLERQELIEQFQHPEVGNKFQQADYLERRLLTETWLRDQARKCVATGRAAPIIKKLLHGCV